MGRCCAYPSLRYICANALDSGSTAAWLYSECFECCREEVVSEGRAVIGLSRLFLAIGVKRILEERGLATEVKWDRKVDRDIETERAETNTCNTTRYPQHSSEV